MVRATLTDTAVEPHLRRIRSFRSCLQLTDLLQHSDGLTLVFCETKTNCAWLARRLEGSGVRCEAIHGDRSQVERNRAMSRFASGDVRVLVATDVAARGIDVEGVTHVINYLCPED